MSARRLVWLVMWTEDLRARSYVNIASSTLCGLGDPSLRSENLVCRPGGHPVGSSTETTRMSPRDECLEPTPSEDRYPALRLDRNKRYPIAVPRHTVDIEVLPRRVMGGNPRAGLETIGQWLTAVKENEERVQTLLPESGGEHESDNDDAHRESGE